MSPKSNIGAWMKFFPDDWMTSVRSMPLAARGAYIELLAYGWDNDLPEDVEALALIVGVGLEEFAPLWTKWLRRKFVVVELEGGGSVLRNRKQEEVRAAQEAVLDGRAAGGRKRWEGTTPEERSASMKTTRRAGQRADDELGDELGDERDTSCRREDSRTPGLQDSGHQEPGSRTQDPEQGAAKLRPARPRAGAARPRRDGAAELREALVVFEAELGRPLRSDLIAAAEGYVVARRESRRGLWSSKQWLMLLQKEHGRDPMPLIEGLLQATQAGWASVHVKRRNGYASGPTKVERSRRAIEEVREAARAAENAQ